LRAQQIARRDAHMADIYAEIRKNRQRSVDDFNAKHAGKFSFSDFAPGMWVLRHETWLDNQHGNKDQWRWAGPFIIHEKRDNKSYVLRELDGTVIRGHVTAHRLKLFYYRAEHQTLRTAI
ncbi:hypothetical protein FA95DRAFT_1454415, partial [Auriscalpium vulgare]